MDLSRIQSATQRDLPEILAIEQETTNPGRWDLRQFREELRRPATTFLVAKVSIPDSTSIAGFLVVLSMGEEHEILNLGTKSACQRHGIASALLQHFIKIHSGSGRHRLFLEVRRSNLPARRFYRKMGFQPAGIRKKYYRNPPEDAVIMSRNPAEE